MLQVRLSLYVHAGNGYSMASAYTGQRAMNFFPLRIYILPGIV